MKKKGQRKHTACFNFTSSTQTSLRRWDVFILRLPALVYFNTLPLFFSGPLHSTPRHYISGVCLAAIFFFFFLFTPRQPLFRRFPLTLFHLFSFFWEGAGMLPGFWSVSLRTVTLYIYIYIFFSFCVWTRFISRSSPPTNPPPFDYHFWTLCCFFSRIGRVRGKWFFKRVDWTKVINKYGS